MLILSISQYQIIAVKSGIFGQKQHSYILLCLFLYLNGLGKEFPGEVVGAGLPAV